MSCDAVCCFLAGRQGAQTLQGHELNGSVSSGEYSWWRLEGYDTFNDDGEGEEPMLRHEE